jgi:hypothetical protein
MNLALGLLVGAAVLGTIGLAITGCVTVFSSYGTVAAIAASACVLITILAGIGLVHVANISASVLGSVAAAFLNR